MDEVRGLPGPLRRGTGATRPPPNLRENEQSEELRVRHPPQTDVRVMPICPLVLRQPPDPESGPEPPAYSIPGVRHPHDQTRIHFLERCAILGEFHFYDISLVRLSGERSKVSIDEAI